MNAMNEVFKILVLDASSYVLMCVWMLNWEDKMVK